MPAPKFDLLGQLFWEVPAPDLPCNSLNNLSEYLNRKISETTDRMESRKRLIPYPALHLDPCSRLRLKLERSLEEEDDLKTAAFKWN